MAKVANFSKWSPLDHENNISKSKATIETINSLGKIVDGTEEEVPDAMIDGDGFYRPDAINI